MLAFKVVHSLINALDSSDLFSDSIEFGEHDNLYIGMGADDN